MPIVRTQQEPRTKEPSRQGSVALGRARPSVRGISCVRPMRRVPIVITFLGFGVQRIRSQILIRGCLHANSEAIDGGEGAVGKNHDFVGR
jgi:hypothetical protein